MRFKYGVLGVAIALLAASCGVGGIANGESALDHQIERAEGVAYGRPWSNVGELVDFVVENHDREGFGGMRIVTGEFVAVEPGIGMNWDEEAADPGQMIELPYGDEEAAVESVHFTFMVDGELAPHTTNVKGEITIGVVFDPGFSLDRIEKDYLGLGRVVVFLEQSPVFAYQPGTYGIVDDGLLLGTIDDNNTVELLMVQERPGFAPDRLTIADLTAS